jgi:hypothetical protein
MFTLEFLEFLAHPAGEMFKNCGRKTVGLAKLKNNCQPFYCQNLSITGSYGFFLVTKYTAKNYIW